MKKKLTKKITETEFDNGYWYASEIKSFAKEIGVRHFSKLRKDELEKIIKHFIRTGKTSSSTRKNIVQSGKKDYELGLKLNLKIINYTNNQETKRFLEKEALKINLKLKRKSGARYRLNRWREEQIDKGRKITYGDLVRQYVKLNDTSRPFKKIPHGRYINFLADYLANEKNRNREDAIKAWKKLKKLNIPKDYQSWKKSNRS
ncbi:SAP domain-containing protein [bacterium]|nr:SAP domain-containing protein [bacterium]